ncbi:SAM-dependent chlorinase/fluorinase [Thiohalobacter sp. IOR34]|uniref:SAM hydrolase/SAM-dependent halogenase family protein n=1 Tax=Thiohalobacter sp. IOR34 TaxID=3057176 RepID=UPI0025B034F6|nr:SAM-dependent chlorinase/fluorinase [Thiohalobacter sp. IOR34]WJW75021.1 SAM-dependent chlorinase/fluorinase [Thiohalobacter sp. IOR34]
MIVLATDFGLEGPYTGQMKAVLSREAPGIPVIDLFADLPAFEIQAAAYLLAAYVGEFPSESVFLCVVDPGVGSGRRPVVARADGRWYVGPDNGLFNVVAARAEQLEWWDIEWRPARLSASFHGRDLFAPVAARLACGEPVPGRPSAAASRTIPGWPAELAKVVYIDHYGNIMTGIRAASVRGDSELEAAGRQIRRARTFSDLPPGGLFWYENANGLVEIAVNQGRAADILQLAVGDRVHFHGQL